MSLTKAEFIALSEMVSEIMFCKNALNFLKMQIDLPVNIFVDDMGTLYLAKNNTNNSQIQHVDTCIMFVKKFIQDSVLQIN